MSDKKYQVFISSTYEDLKEERNAVEQTIIRSGDFPVGMEAFPAADEEQFEFIKTIIAQCDYYVLIIAGRYGSLAPDGKSYTHKEYEYAVEIGVPVLVMLRDDRGELPASKTEAEPEKRSKLEKFILAASEGRLRKGWRTTDGLKLVIREALDHAKATKHRPGWIRGDQSASTETLGKLVAAQEEISVLKQELMETGPKFVVPADIAGLDVPIVLTGSYKIWDPQWNEYIDQPLKVKTDLGKIFALVAPHLMQPVGDPSVSALIAECTQAHYAGDNFEGINFSTTDELFQTIKIQLMALNLVNVSAEKVSSGGTALLWSLTDLGREEMFRRRVITIE